MSVMWAYVGLQRTEDKKQNTKTGSLGYSEWIREKFRGIFKYSVSESKTFKMPLKYSD